MPLDKLLMYAARITWRHRSWWILGLVATVGGLLFNLLFRSIGWYAVENLTLNSFDLQSGIEGFINVGTLITGVSAGFILGLIIWLVSAVGEGALIVAVVDRGERRAMGLGSALRAGVGLLGRFIGIDTLLFLPLFILALLLMVVGFGGLAGLILTATRPAAEFTDLILVTGLATAVSIPIAVLILLVTIVISLLRVLAFRAAAMEGKNAAVSVKRGWHILRRQTLSVAVVALVLAAIRSLLGAPLRIASAMLAGLAWSQFAFSLSESSSQTSNTDLLVGLASIVLVFVSWLVSGIMHAYGSSSWTLSYEQWTKDLA